MICVHDYTFQLYSWHAPHLFFISGGSENYRIPNSSQFISPVNSEIRLLLSNFLYLSHYWKCRFSFSFFLIKCITYVHVLKDYCRGWLVRYKLVNDFLILEDKYCKFFSVFWINFMNLLLQTSSVRLLVVFSALLSLINVYFCKAISLPT